MKNGKTNILAKIAIFSVLIPLWRTFVRSCSKKRSIQSTTPASTNAITTSPELDEDYYKCEGKISKIHRQYNQDTKNSGNHGSVNMTAAMLGQMSLSVRPPCVISLELEQIGEVRPKIIDASKRVAHLQLLLACG